MKTFRAGTSRRAFGRLRAVLRIVEGSPWKACVCIAFAAGVGCRYIDFDQSRRSRPDPATVFTPAHSTFGAAVRDFFWIKPRPYQPIEFPHNTHVEKRVMCTAYCHEGVTQGPMAGIPSVRTCMICHQAIATDRPLIKQIAALEEKGLDLQWQRVYAYPAEAHVRFNHAPHIRANVDCSTCHGDIAHQTVAQRNVDLHMGFCVNCHQQTKAPNECVTCHF